MAWLAKTIAGMTAALLIGLVVSFAWGRLRPLTAAQTQALALLTPASAPPAGAPNAWATFWLLDYDVPAADLDVVYAQEREHLETWTERFGMKNPTGETYVDRVGQYFPKRPTLTVAQRKQLCSPTDHDCLGKVRANLQPVRELLTSQAGRLAQLRAITPDAVMWDDMPNATYTPLPQLGSVGNLRLTAAALDFANGRKVQALAQVCRDARTVRHLHAHTNSLIGAMVANSWMYPIERLLADMLTELPPDQSIPEDCSVAFAPVTRADIDMCAPAQREYQGLQHVLADVVPDKTHPVDRLEAQFVFDLEHSRGLTAPTYAWVCRPAVIDSVLADRPVNSMQEKGVRHDFFDVVSNPTGVFLAQIPNLDFVSYLNRNEDYAAGLRAMGWLLANRGTTTTPDNWRRQFVTARPALQQGGIRDIRLDPAAERLIMPYTEKRPHHDELALPLTK